MVKGTFQSENERSEAQQPARYDESSGQREFRSLVENSPEFSALISAFMDHLPGAAWVKDLKGRYVYANREAARSLSVPLEGILGRTDEELFLPETARQFQENDRRALSEGGSVQVLEIVLQANGRERQSMVKKFLLPGPNGQTAYVAGVAFDISERQRTEEALRQSEARLRMLTETLPAVPWSANSEGKIEYFSEKWLEWTGLTLAQALGEGWKQVVPAEDVARIQMAAEHSIRTGEPFEMEHRLRQAKDGTYRWYRSRALPERDATGRIVRWHGLTDDIHEAKTALEAVKASENQLREKEQRLRLALETAALGSYERNLITNTVYLNANCREILGVPEGPPDPQIAYKSLYPEDRERVLATVARAFDPARREVCGAEFRIVRPDGTLRWVAGRGRVVFDDSVQPARGLKFLGVLHDITERKLAEESLQNQNRQLSLLSQTTANLLLADEPEEIVAAIAEQLPEYLQVDGILEFVLGEQDAELHLKGCWGAGCELLARGLERLKFGEGPSGQVALERQPLVWSRTQQPPSARLQVVEELGIQAYACYPLIVGERLLGTLAFASRRRARFGAQEQQLFETLAGYVALTQERQRMSHELRQHAESLAQTVEERTSQLRENVAELEHIGYSMIHDMRAPLRAMSSYAQMLLMSAATRLEAEEKDFLERIMSAAARMDQLVRDVLHYNRVLRAELPLAPVDIPGVLGRILRTRPEFQEPKAKICLQGFFPKVLANEDALAQCCTQFLENAVKFVAPGRQPEVRIWAQLVDSGKLRVDRPTPSGHQPSTIHQQQTDSQPSTLNHPLVRLWFEDNGLGIPPGCQQRIFALFHQMHVGYAGTGIGLALVRKLAQRMGGHVGVESEEGKGSRFWLELRAAETPPTADPA